MDKRLGYLERYLENTQLLLTALTSHDLEQMRRCLDENAEIMKGYALSEARVQGAPANHLLKEKAKAIFQVNQVCASLIEKNRLALVREIENIDKNRESVRKYGSKQTHRPKFIDHNI